MIFFYYIEFIIRKQQKSFYPNDTTARFYGCRLPIKDAFVESLKAVGEEWVRGPAGIALLNAGSRVAAAPFGDCGPNVGGAG